MADVLCRALSDLLVEVAMDGREAWRKLNESEYDLVIADLNLPGIHGQDLLRMMLENGIETPALIISGMPLSEDAADMLSESRYRVVLKPFRLAKIRAQAMDLLGVPDEDALE